MMSGPIKLKRAGVEGVKRLSSASSKPSNPIPASKRPRKDFFGRVIDDSKIQADKGTDRLSEKTQAASFWYKYNEGYSNAVRREVKMKHFMELLNKK
jgi:hypothetical protein